MRTPYDQIALIPAVVAKTVCEREYTGSEGSGQDVAKVEGLRRAMTPAHVQAFVKHFDTLCRLAYKEQAEWFMKCVRSQSNRGRDQLYVWAAHQLCGFLLGNYRPKLFEKVGRASDMVWCQLFMGDHLVAVGRAKGQNDKQAISNAYRNYGRS